MESIAELVAKLQQHKSDLFGWDRYLKEIAGRGYEALGDLITMIPGEPPLLERTIGAVLAGLKEDSAQRERAREDLEHMLAPNRLAPVRMVCMRLLAGHYPEATHVGQRFIDFAANRDHEGAEIRRCAILCVEKLRPTSALGRGLVGMLGDPEETLVAHTLDILRGYTGHVPSEEAIRELERLASPTSSPELSIAVRCSAIELLGVLGEVDVLERIILLPLKDEREREAVGKLVRNLLAKARSVLHLSPKSFEHLIGRLLESMSYQDVAVQPKASWDEGVDVVAKRRDDLRLKGPEDVKVIVQCKRYGRTKLVGEDVIEAMVKTVRDKGAARGLIITTSGFTPAAHECQRQYQHIELIDGAALQALLDKSFGKGVYRVRV